jgi:hypothetical protein
MSWINIIDDNIFLTIESKMLFYKIKYENLLDNDNISQNNDINFLSHYQEKILNIIYLFNDCVIFLSNIHISKPEMVNDGIIIWKLFINFLQENQDKYDNLYEIFQNIFEYRNVLIHNFINYDILKTYSKELFISITNILNILYNYKHLYNDSQSFMYFFNKLYIKMLKTINNIYTGFIKNNIDDKISNFISK